MTVLERSRDDVEDLADAERDFHRRYPEFDPTGAFARLRSIEYGRLDATGTVYLDYTGGGIHGISQIDGHAELLRTTVFGNPHSSSAPSLAATSHVETARRQVLEFFHASSDDYLCVFTANASAALKLVGESYPFGPDVPFALTADNHNSVNGIREFARRRGAPVRYVPVKAPELRLDRQAMSGVLSGTRTRGPSLLAFPAQSNYSGVQHPLGLIDEAHDHGWDVLVDAAAFAPTNRFDVGHFRPDFVVVSFYKVFGFPTGVGCLLIRRDRFERLSRPWFSGGTVTVASVAGDGHYLHTDESAFEDGTVDYLNLAAVVSGLRYVDRIDRDAIHRRVACLTEWLLDGLAGLHHTSGRPVVKVFGPMTMVERGGTIAFEVHDRDGHAIDPDDVERMANRSGISLRSGCFCNPGASEAAHGFGTAELTTWFTRPGPVTHEDLRDGLFSRYGRGIGAVRASVGVATNFADVHRFMCFVEAFVDQAVEVTPR